jgi:hypothetical protein
MRGTLALLASIALAMFCWGVYGPVLREGQLDMAGSSLRPFICVGMAYFLIAVLAPSAVMQVRPEPGHWSTSGIFWSLAAGAVGALGALGIILALSSGGSPVYVMPLVFGCAPVVNTFLTMYWARSYKQAGPVFIAGLILVVLGAVTVLLSRPHGHAAAESAPLTPQQLTEIILFTAMTALSWGVYGPMLHRGQMGMAGSRLRPLICVGLAYFLIAVLVPLMLLTQWDKPDAHFTFNGTLWSLGGGAAGALGALGIILAFNFGGKPIYVMPLVFGGAPVINTFASVLRAGTFSELPAMFYAGLIVVAAGAVTVLVFSPKGGHAPPAKKTKHEAAPAS